MFRLINSETVPLTPDLAQQFRTLTPSPTERPFDESRAKMLRTAAENGKLVAFNWAQATFSGKTIRMNGQHSSSVLCELSGAFPQGLKVHLDTYQVDDKEGLADLFRQFDSRKSGRTPGDVAGAYQGLHDELRDVPRASAKLAVEGAAWFDRCAPHGRPPFLRIKASIRALLAALHRTGCVHFETLQQGDNYALVRTRYSRHHRVRNDHDYRPH